MFGKIWKFLSGKKTVIGMGIVIVGRILKTITGNPVWEVVETVGTGIGGVGLAHKAIKENEAKDNEIIEKELP
jgi:hypothetical protein